jgi:hypothetical protein
MQSKTKKKYLKKTKTKTKTKKQMGGVYESVAYRRPSQPAKQTRKKSSAKKSSAKKSSGRKSNAKKSSGPKVKLFENPNLRENYYKKAQRNRRTGQVVDNPGNRSLIDLDNQDILSLIGKHTFGVRERKRREKREREQREYELRRQYEIKRQESEERKNAHAPNCNCHIDGPPGGGTCPECGAYYAY